MTPKRDQADTRMEGVPRGPWGLPCGAGSHLEEQVILGLLQTWWLTTWFRVLCGVLLLGLLWTLFQMRVRQLARRFDLAVETRVSERTRIARELHDSLLQDFQGFVLRIQTVQSLLPVRQEEAQRMLGRAIEQAIEAIAEGRSAVQGQQSLAVETYDFSEAINTLGQELANDPSNQSSIAVRVTVQGTPRPLEPLVRDEIYRIGADALRNAYRQPEARGIEVELRYHERSFELCVREDGTGIDPAILRDMQERSKGVGGTLTIRTAPASGTELQLSVPGAIVYGTGP